MTISIRKRAIYKKQVLELLKNQHSYFESSCFLKNKNYLQDQCFFSYFFFPIYLNLQNQTLWHFHLNSIGCNYSSQSMMISFTLKDYRQVYLMSFSNERQRQFFKLYQFQKQES